jgi:cytosine/adenosine deaminase-related metal-dependent hydrolase
MKPGVNRRQFLGGAAALGVAAYAEGVQAAEEKRTSRTGRLPGRAEFVVRNGYVLTMDPALGDLPRGDVYVKNGEIVAVGSDLKAPGAPAIDGRGMIVLPGFVDTHWHMWNTLLRSMAGDKKEHGYFPTVATLGKIFTPGDMYQGTRLAAAEALASGFTFVHDWCHNIRSPEFAAANLKALRESGLRGRFSYGSPQAHPATETIDLADLERLRRDWKSHSSDGLLDLGLAWRGMGAAPAPIPPEVYRKEFDTARSLGLPISVHVANFRSRAGQVQALAQENLLGKDVQVIHAIWVTPEEIKSLAAAGTPVSFSPYTELRIGFGFPLTGDFLAAGVTVGLSVDTTVLSGNADMFAIMKVIQNVENSRTENEFKLPARRVLELATIEGARSMGVGDRVGSLKPGKRADLIMVSTRDVNLGVFTDPAHLLVEAAQPSNVDTVVVDGRILKRRGRLTVINTAQLVGEASTALAAVRKRGNWW